MGETLFTKVEYPLGSLIESISVGVIGLPDIQRPFVWTNTQVKDLFDSMYKGFPFGYFLFWKTGAGDGSRTIGADKKQKYPELLIVDGQQRLTSLYAVIKGAPIVRETYEPEAIDIAFNPLIERFEVQDASVRNDIAYLPNISCVWSSGMYATTEDYLKRLAETRPVTEAEKQQISRAFWRLSNLLSFPCTTLELLPTIDEEQVSEIFVRINSQGKRLDNSDFIMTLVSVFWDEGRAKLEDFSRKSRIPTKQLSSFNHLIEPAPDQLLRVSVALGFRRARLKHVYSILRGKDVRTGQFSSERREEQFSILKNAQGRVLDFGFWQDFLKCIVESGYCSPDLMNSERNLLFAYALYLIGRTEFGIGATELRRIIARWIFMTTITGRYSSSGDTRLESDLAKLGDMGTSPQSFEKAIEALCDASLTDAFWRHKLPGEFKSSAANSLAMNAYFAALNIFQARALFSKRTVAEFFDPVARTANSGIERRLLFPRPSANQTELRDLRDNAQNANVALIEWGRTLDMGAPPRVYVPELSRRFSSAELADMYHWHALPDNWETMPFDAFLRRRRELMAKVVRDAYSLLCREKTGRDPERTTSAAALVEAGEGEFVEFKSTLRMNLKIGRPDPQIEFSALKTIAAFLNGRGGTLVIGVDDERNVLGVQADVFTNEDKMDLHLGNLVKERLGKPSTRNIVWRFENVNGGRVMVVECRPSKTPVFLKDGNIHRFFTRTGAATSEMSGSDMHEFTRDRFTA